MITEKIVYFETPGRCNTRDTLTLTRERCEARGITSAVIATHTGYTTEQALDVFADSGISLVFVGSTRSRLTEGIQARVEEAGCSLAFAREQDFQLSDEANLVLRRFSEGMRVGLLCMLIAANLNLIPAGRKTAAVAGTGTLNFGEEGGGADTAFTVTACTSEDYFTTRPRKQDRRNIHEIICMPL